MGMGGLLFAAIRGQEGFLGGRIPIASYALEIVPRMCAVPPCVTSGRQSKAGGTDEAAPSGPPLPLLKELHERWRKKGHVTKPLVLPKLASWWHNVRGRLPGRCGHGVAVRRWSRHEWGRCFGSVAKQWL